MAEKVGGFHMIALDAFAEEMGWFENKTSNSFFKLDVKGLNPRLERVHKSYSSRKSSSCLQWK